MMCVSGHNGAVSQHRARVNIGCGVPGMRCFASACSICCMLIKAYIERSNMFTLNVEQQMFLCLAGTCAGLMPGFRTAFVM